MSHIETALRRRQGGLQLVCPWCPSCECWQTDPWWGGLTIYPGAVWWWLSVSPVMSSPGESRSRSGRDTPETLDTTDYSQRDVSVLTRKTDKVFQIHQRCIDTSIYQPGRGEVRTENWKKMGAIFVKGGSEEIHVSLEAMITCVVTNEVHGESHWAAHDLLIRSLWLHTIEWKYIISHWLGMLMFACNCWLDFHKYCCCECIRVTRHDPWLTRQHPTCSR